MKITITEYVAKKVKTTPCCVFMAEALAQQAIVADEKGAHLVSPFTPSTWPIVCCPFCGTKITGEEKGKEIIYQAFS